MQSSRTGVWNWTLFISGTAVLTWAEPSALSVSRAWINPAGGMYGVAGNWNPAGAPLATEDAGFELQSTYAVAFDAAYSCVILTVDDRATFQLGGFQYSVNGIVIENAAPPLGSLTLLNGTIATSGVGFFVEVGAHAGLQGVLNVASRATLSGTSNLYIGHAGTGSMVLDGLVSVPTSFIADNVGSSGSATVQGLGNWTNSASLVVGNNGIGSLNVTTGANVLTSIGSFGDNLGSQGSLTVNGTGSKYKTTSSMFIGNTGTGSAMITSGGKLVSLRAFIGDDVGGGGTVTLQGVGSNWTDQSNIFVGNFGSGQVHVLSGATLSSVACRIGDEIASTGTATVSGAGSNWASSIDLITGNHGTGNLNIAAGATVSTAAGSIGDDLEGIGTVNVSGAGSSLSCTSLLTVGRFGQGTLSIAAGCSVTSPSVSVNSLSKITGLGIINGNVSNSGTISPGMPVGTLTVQGTYTQTASGRLETELGFAAADKIAVQSTVNLGGTLNVTYTAGASPCSGQQVTVVTGSSVLGAFSQINSPTAVSLIQNPTNVKVRILVAPSVGGDVNRNGVTNIDDLVAVISAWGACPPNVSCCADLNSSGQVNIDDLVAVIIDWD